MENNKSRGSSKNINLIFDLALFLGGAIAFSILLPTGGSFLTAIDPALPLAFLYVSLIALWGGAVSLTFDLAEFKDPFKVLSVSLKSFRDGRQAIVKPIVVAIIGIMITMIVWFPLGWVAYDVIDTFTSQFYFPPVALGVIRLMEWVLAWTPAIVIVGLLIYVIVNAFKTEYPSAPYEM